MGPVSNEDLMRITGIGGRYAEILEAVGVHSVVGLSQRDPAELADAMLEVNLGIGLVRALPTKKRIAGWVAQARRLESVVSH